MNWYYVDAGKQAGPVEDSQLEELRTQGKVQPDTLVWREGLADWQPYSQTHPAAATSAAAPIVLPGQAVCAECGQLFDLQNMITYGNLRVCAQCKPIFVQKLAEGAKLETGALNYAGFWIRFGAKLIDGLILLVVLIVPLIYLGIKSAAQARSGSGQVPAAFQALQLLFNLGYLALRVSYEIFFLGKYGATPGKMACGLQVITADGGKLSYGRAAGRAFAEILSGLICYIGYIIAAFDDEKRALHDHICNTRVVLK